MRAKQKRAERKKPLTGKKVGKHIVMAGEVDVQLKEEISENLRELRVCLGRSLGSCGWIDSFLSCI